MTVADALCVGGDAATDGDTDALAFADGDTDALTLLDGDADCDAARLRETVADNVFVGVIE